MKTQYKYIHFIKIADKPKTTVWTCHNNTGGFEIGMIRWNPGWRQYCFFPSFDTIFSVGCLQDICRFITELKGVHP